ncbi:hypothetical protein DAPPUDRAFT_262109 [Daphnia pulex]|uniref:Uncharacterized protein n=1 Tax=Daphnia pulex TaxID=6669 RepID=E9HMD3_DAPPU|nr:hypothetical protein DAPPUDRAFT_262109 [Daphnia pulex]|eukprot:EFX67126.1 hypothetical protein DAPPUDRAFT_262109 [Daphnia pulex]
MGDGNDAEKKDPASQTPAGEQLGGEEKRKKKEEKVPTLAPVKSSEVVRSTTLSSWPLTPPPPPLAGKWTSSSSRASGVEPNWRAAARHHYSRAVPRSSGRNGHDQT